MNCATTNPLKMENEHSTSAMSTLKLKVKVWVGALRKRASWELYLLQNNHPPGCSKIRGLKRVEVNAT